MLSSTKDKISYVAFKLFLEKGYEATNMREISNEVGIKASSLYFYYESKQELFFSIYDEMWRDKLRFIENIEELKQNISPDIKLYILFKSTIEYCSKDIAKQKFLLRYHLFPPEDLIKVLRDKFKFWTDKENTIIADLVKECIDKKILSRGRKVTDYLKDYIRFTNFQIIEMIISNIKISNKEINNLWLKFWNNNFLS
ncbi:MAG: TetR/AcrR family transcriptional regulator [Tepidanaerobacteraceae bacterium]